MPKRKNVSATLSAERAYQASKSQANRSNWHDHAIFFAADTLAAQFHNDPTKFRMGVASYEAYSDKKNFHEQVARKIVALLKEEADSRPEIDGGTPNPITNLGAITEGAVRKLLQRHREQFAEVFAERMLAIGGIAKGGRSK